MKNNTKDDVVGVFVQAYVKALNNYTSARLSLVLSTQLEHILSTSDLSAFGNSPESFIATAIDTYGGEHKEALRTEARSIAEEQGKNWLGTLHFSLGDELEAVVKNIMANMPGGLADTMRDLVNTNTAMEILDVTKKNISTAETRYFGAVVAFGHNHRYTAAAEAHLDFTQQSSVRMLEKVTSTMPGL